MKEFDPRTSPMSGDMSSDRTKDADKQGGLTAIESGQSSVPAKQYAEAMDEIKRLQRLLGQMASDNALLKEAVEIMTGKKWTAR